MSAKIITDTSRVKPDVSARVWDLYVDNDIIPGIPPGTINPGANNTFLRTNNLGLVQWNPFTLSDIPHGATGTVLSSNGSSISWQVPTVTPGGIIPGTNGQVLVTQGGVSQWTSNPNISGNLGVTGSSRFTANGLFQQDLAVTNDLNVLNGDLTVINGGFEVTTGLSKVQSLDIAGDLLFNTSPGNINDVITKTGPNTQQWATPTNVRLIRYCCYLAAQDLNAGIGPTPIVFDTSNTISNLSNGSVSLVNGISQPSTTTFLVGTLGTYDIDITGFCSGAGVGNSSFAITAEVNGLQVYRSVVTNGTTRFFSGRLPSILITAGGTLRLLVSRLAGTSSLLTNAPLSLPNNFSSTIAITLVNIV